MTENKTEATVNTQPTLTASPPQPSSSHTGITTSIIALIIAIGAAGGVAGLWWHTEQHAHHYTERFHKFEELTQQQFTTQQQLSQQLMQTQNQLLQQQNNMTSLQANLQKIQQGQPGYNRAWTLAEVDYTLHLANLELIINHSTDNAILLLQTANDRLTKLSDPTLTSVIQSINSELSTLQSLPKIDMGDINSHINHIQDEIDQLSQTTEANITSPSSAQNQTNMTNLPWWKKIIPTIHAELKKFVVIKYHNKPLPALLPASAQTYLQQNIQLLLLQTQVAAMQYNQTIYQNTLQKIKNLLNQYYVQDAPSTKAVLQELNTLQQINLQPNYPDLSATFNMINAAKTATDSTTSPSTSTQITR